MRKYIRYSLLEKFMRHVEIPSPDRQASCWVWTGSVDGKGYGQINAGVGIAPYKAHRVAWTLAYGGIADGLFVCHGCDNPRCVKPAHLFLGTQTDNMNDCSLKGRVRRKIAPEEAWEIRYAPGKHRDIAARFGVSKSAVTAIKAGKTWKNAYPAATSADAIAVRTLLQGTAVNYVKNRSKRIAALRRSGA